MAVALSSALLPSSPAALAMLAAILRPVSKPRSRPDRSAHSDRPAHADRSDRDPASDPVFRNQARPGAAVGRSARFFAPLAALLLPLLAACTSVTPVRRAEVQELMERQQEAWNRGDLRSFVSYYRQDEDMTFIGGQGITHGGARLLENYRRSYPDAASRGRLEFDLVGLRPVGARAALVLGRYHLERAEPASGYFTLLVERTPYGLQIVHDHSSEGPAGAAPATPPDLAAGTGATASEATATGATAPGATAPATPPGESGPSDLPGAAGR